MGGHFLRSTLSGPDWTQSVQDVIFYLNHHYPNLANRLKNNNNNNPAPKFVQTAIREPMTAPHPVMGVRARVGRSRVACVGVCAVSARAGWGRRCFSRALRGGGVGGRVLAGRGWWASRCALLLRGRGAACGRRGRGSLARSLVRSLSLARSLALSLSLSLPGLSGMVHVSDVHHWIKSARSTPPRMFCLLSRAANVRAWAYAHGHVRARERA